MDQPDDLAALGRSLLDAHERDDTQALIRLYREAGSLKEQAGDIDAACFYYTHAYVFALETGDAAARPLLEKLVEHGREAFAPNDRGDR